ncbi:MAG: DUF1549 domain-containing protein, partial [Planctomycetales bacterium]|nr:DUF1549 domain-containing protein [Planctomycetales bacterium]
MSIHAVAAPRDVQFNRDVRPILADKCFACHGPDEAHREAGLRFDLEESAKALHDGAAAIVPGQPDASHLITRITTDDADLRMPPTDSGKELSQKEIDTLRRWIADGAKYESHWSFLPPSRPTVPEVDDEAWPVNDIDRFILARLQREGLRPSPEADRATLIRRLSFDLVGLPPSVEEVDAFVGDQRPDAYERLVDRLLESPHFGERMAMYWLDLVRYANTVGYHGDQEHAITPYRDWVIHAFNTNLPFDQFTAEQLAGDLLPDRTTDQRIASGYNRLLQTSHEGGVQVKEYLSKYDADRVRNVSSVWMGATVGCAQCHDHKYDPYTMRDFYSLAAFFADVDDARTFRGGDTTPTKREPEIETLSPLDRLAIERLRKAAESCQQQIEVRRASSAEPESQSELAELESERKR